MHSKQKTKYLIDTNIYGLSLRQNHGQISNFLSGLEIEDSVVSCFVLAEIEVLLYLIKDSLLNIHLKNIIESLRQVEPLWFDKNQLKIYTILKYKMSLLGRSNRTIDWFIAAQALDQKCVLVTANRKDFENIPGLKLKIYDQKNCRWLK